MKRPEVRGPLEFGCRRMPRRQNFTLWTAFFRCSG